MSAPRVSPVRQRGLWLVRPPHIRLSGDELTGYCPDLSVTVAINIRIMCDLGEGFIRWSVIQIAVQKLVPTAIRLVLGQ